MKISYYASSLTGSTGVNGDVFYVSPDKKVFLLADGASGAGEHGKVLMGKTCIEIVNSFDFKKSGLDAKAYIDCLFKKINQRLIELSQQYNNLISGTIILAVFDKNLLTVTTFGDSPAYLYHQSSIIRVAKNKKRYENMVDRGYITRDEYDDYINQMHPMMKSCFDFFFTRYCL